MPTARASETADPIAAFFSHLTEPGRIPTFAGESATIRFDIRAGAEGGDVDRWNVAVSNGAVTVTRRNGQPDAIVKGDRPHFEQIVTGRLNASAALLRGLLICEGSVAALMMFQRCLPGPPDSTGRVAPISSRAVMAEHGGSHE